jgi:hypothetical protein
MFAALLAGQRNRRNGGPFPHVVRLASRESRGVAYPESSHKQFPGAGSIRTASGVQVDGTGPDQRVESAVSNQGPAVHRRNLTSPGVG